MFSIYHLNKTDLKKQFLSLKFSKFNKHNSNASTRLLIPKSLKQRTECKGQFAAFNFTWGLGLASLSIRNAK